MFNNVQLLEYFETWKDLQSVEKRIFNKSCHFNKKTKNSKLHPPNKKIFYFFVNCSSLWTKWKLMKQETFKKSWFANLSINSKQKNCWNLGCALFCCFSKTTKIFSRSKKESKKQTIFFFSNIFWNIVIRRILFLETRQKKRTCFEEEFFCSKRVEIFDKRCYYNWKQKFQSFQKKFIISSLFFMQTIGNNHQWT